MEQLHLFDATLNGLQGIVRIAENNIEVLWLQLWKSY
jgi:hypothetical protein